MDSVVNENTCFVIDTQTVNTVKNSVGIECTVEYPRDWILSLGNPYPEVMRVHFLQSTRSNGVFIINDSI